MPRVALLATPGVGLRKVQGRLERLKGVENVIDVEDILLKREDLWASSRLKAVPYESRKMRSFTEAFTRGQVLDEWAEAYSEAASISQTTEIGTSVISFHPSLYSQRRSELYSTLLAPMSSVTFVKFDHVVLLIDDIYDMQSRLGGTQDIFELESSLSKELVAQRLGKYRADKPPKSGDPERETWCSLRAEHINTIMGRLATWRRFDMIQAELLAQVHKCRLTVLGVKHPLRTLEELVTEPTRAHTSYLSHPISRPRRAFNKREIPVWPPKVVLDSNLLGDRLAALEQSVELVMPTAIDELRVTGPATTDPFKRSYSLTARWPRLSETDEIVPNENPADLPVDSEMAGEQDLNLGSQARSLERLIYGEVPFRDHFLVAHTDSFLVYRPFFGCGNEAGGKFSAGVKAEIRHWADAASVVKVQNQDRRAVFIHSSEDVKRLADCLENPSDKDKDEQSVSDSARYALRTKLNSVLQNDIGIQPSDAWLLCEGRELSMDMLDSAKMDSVVAGNIQKQIENARTKCVADYLVELLTDVHSEELLRGGKIALVVMQNDQLSDRELGEIGSFLHGTRPWPQANPDSVYVEPFLDPYGRLSRSFTAGSLSDWYVNFLTASR